MPHPMPIAYRTAEAVGKGPITDVRGTIIVSWDRQATDPNYSTSRDEFRHALEDVIRKHIQHEAGGLATVELQVIHDIKTA